MWWGEAPNTPVPREWLILGAAALAAGSLGIGLYLKGRKTPEEKERQRRLLLNLRGRIAEGSLLQLVEQDGRRLLCYQYSVSQVSYSAAQDITTLRPLVRLEGICDGVPARVKYDPQNPSDSIVVCEKWNGLE